VLGNNPDDKVKAAFVAWATANLPSRATPTPSMGDLGFSTAGERVDYLAKTYRSRHAPHSTYTDCYKHVLNAPENAELKRAFAAETGRART
jgi:hypothetical protein